MNALSIRLLSLALFAVLCATATYWVVTLSAHQAPLPAAAARTPVRTEDAAALFGGQLTRNPVQDIHLFGILALQRGAAAIVGIGGDAPHAVSLGSEIAQGAKLAEVRDRSIVVERNGARSEIFLPANTPSPAIYVR
ncbi:MULTISPECIES: general secretion pathway protein GspC [Burkholderia]|uniref:General secretion pathway protein GspC n=1 Tax=Burkholderia savannae TaxID=1637837 RepID=A0ABR5T924_9BURK|nr:MULTISPECIES: general secretion pathway protein GspC [Burkholderia]AOJ70529.1 general secretion pathway protein GspC [Burkholderia savannae]AOJ79308.1 general secretion pathway protein GspC [Burkholderia savannae]AOK45480.1 general secretion pathway protein GspC [Burkholderia sp. MSMB617WGS]KGR99271.1 type IV pilus biogenesis family protein [Burkholderia sp. ABCPW 111]KVG47451.1 general secretion pathway protein GspC [Burkholderia sp. MSMB0265]